MKKIHFEVKTDGFYGAYWKNKKETNSAIIAMLGDDAEDYMAKSCVKWLMKKGVNVLTMSPGKKNYSHHNYPLERIEKAIEWLKNNGNKKIGIVGGSTTGTLALTAASYFPDITLTIAMTNPEPRNIGIRRIIIKGFNLTEYVRCFIPSLTKILQENCLFIIIHVELCPPVIQVQGIARCYFVIHLAIDTGT